MRVLFHPSNFGVAANAGALKMKASLPLSAYDTIEDVTKELSATTDNVGNIIHNEAVAKSFEINSLRSCMAPLYHIFVNESKSDKKLFQAKIKEGFDAVVLSLANLISPPLPGREKEQQKHMELLCEILDALPVPFYMFGLGMQNPVDDINDLVPGMRDFLKLLNDKAAMFGVRGAQTEGFMHKHGYTNAKTLGCPSLYVYPANMLSIETPDLSKNARVLTAGHKWLRTFMGYQTERMDFLRKLAETYKTEYVYQDDFYSFHELGPVRGFYDDATGRVNKDIMDDYMTVHGVEPIPFENLWHFRDGRTWRLLAEKTDFYFGDRFHGGVVSLQVGKPALFMYKDLRVQELTDHIGVPSCSFDDLEGRDYTEVLEEAFSKERLEQFKDTYAMRAREYYDYCTERGMTPLAQIRSRSTRSVGYRFKWQQQLADILKAKSDAGELPVKSNAAMKVVLRDQYNHKSGELLLRALVADNMDAELNQVAKILTDLDAGEESRDAAGYFYRIAYFLYGKKKFEAALLFADIYYNSIYFRRGKHTELFACINMDMGNYEQAHKALDCRKDDEGFVARFLILRAKVSLFEGNKADAKAFIDAARNAGVEGGEKGMIATLEKQLGK